MIPQVKQTEKHCGKCGALMELRMGLTKVAFWRCVADDRHIEALTA